MSPLIAFSGYGGSGKDEAAKALIHEGWERRAFADKLREFLMAVNPLVSTATTPPALHDTAPAVRLRVLIEAFGWDKAKRAYPDLRELLQRLGTDAGRQLLGENVWVDATLAGISGPVCIPDCRFPNEAATVRARGGLVVRVYRPGVDPANDHISEIALDGYDFDHLVVNDGTVADLHAKIRALLA